MQFIHLFQQNFILLAIGALGCSLGIFPSYQQFCCHCTENQVSDELLALYGGDWSECSPCFAFGGLFKRESSLLSLDQVLFALPSVSRSLSPSPLHGSRKYHVASSSNRICVCSAFGVTVQVYSVVFLISKNCFFPY